jgi:hypothetical protein
MKQNPLKYHMQTNKFIMRWLKQMKEADAHNDIVEENNKLILI